MSEEQKAAEAESVEEHGADVADQFAAADEAGAPVDPPSLDEIAGRMGWVPEDRFKGPKEKWKPADQFILDGKSIQDRSSRELKEMRQTLDTVARTSGAILAERLAVQREQLARAYEQAVESGDREQAAQALRNYDAVDRSIAESNTPPRPAPSPEAEQWTQANARVMRDPVAAKRALEICDQYARGGYSTQDQLASTEAIMRREFPHLFDTKAAPQVNGAQSRNAAPNNSGGKTARDMPKAAQDVARDMVDRGLIPNVDAYAKNYFAEVEKRKVS